MGDIKGASAQQGPVPGAIVNGPRTVNGGRIINRNIAKLDKAQGIAKALQMDMGHHFTYEVSGVEGNYYIIERDVEPTPSNYID